MDLTLLEYLSNNTHFYFLIALPSVYGGCRSLKLRSIPSRLIFAHPHPSYHHHFCLPHVDSLSATPIRPETSPSPFLRDVGSNPIASAHSQAQTPLHPPLPFPERCRRLRLKLAQWWNEGGRYTRGDLGNGRPMKCVTKHEPRRLSWFVFIIRAHSIPQTGLSQCRRNQQRHELQPPPINHTRSYRWRVWPTINKSAHHRQVQPAIDTYPNNYQVPPIEDTYRPTPLLKYRKVTRPGVEPRTFWTYTRCSNQLSYPALEFNQLILYLCNCQSKDTYSSARHIQCHFLHARSTLWLWHDQISQSGNHVTDYIIQFQQKFPWLHLQQDINRWQRDSLLLLLPALADVFHYPLFDYFPLCLQTSHTPPDTPEAFLVTYS